MATRIFVALAFALSTIGFLSASTPVTFKVTEPISVAGVPPVTLGPGTYILRKVDSSSGVSTVQVLFCFWNATRWPSVMVRSITNWPS